MFNLILNDLLESTYFSIYEPQCKITPWKTWRRKQRKLHWIALVDPEMCSERLTQLWIRHSITNSVVDSGINCPVQCYQGYYVKKKNMSLMLLSCRVGDNRTPVCTSTSPHISDQVGEKIRVLNTVMFIHRRDTSSGPVSISDKTSYRKISGGLEATRLVI